VCSLEFIGLSLPPVHNNFSEKSCGLPIMALDIARPMILVIFTLDSQPQYQEQIRKCRTEMEKLFT
jgi:hypothetical protein